MVKLCQRFCSDNIAADSAFVNLFALGRFGRLCRYCAIIFGVLCKLYLFIASRAFEPVSRCIVGVCVSKAVLVSGRRIYVQQPNSADRDILVIAYLDKSKFAVRTAVPDLVYIIISQISDVARIGIDEIISRKLCPAAPATVHKRKCRSCFRSIFYGKLFSAFEIFQIGYGYIAFIIDRNRCSAGIIVVSIHRV